MSEGIHYRLGILTGRLKAYEHEEDLANLFRERDPKGIPIMYDENGNPIY